MKKITPLLLVIFIFLPSLFYLHQKVQIYVEAYRLSGNYSYHNQLIDKKDYLMYNFTKEISLAKINQWADEQHFVSVGKDKHLFLTAKKEDVKNNSKIAVFFDRFLGASTSTAEAFVEEKQQ